MGFLGGLGSFGLGSWFFGLSWGFLSRLLGGLCLFGGRSLLGSYLLGLDGFFGLFGSGFLLCLHGFGGLWLLGEPDTSTGLGSVNLVVGTDVLQDGLTGGALLVSEGLDGGLDHGGVGRVGSSNLGLGGHLLGFGSSSSSHGDVVLFGR